jgi:hypothetical protein
MSGLVQISERSGWAHRVPRGESPVIELDLEDHQYIASFEMGPSMFDSADRKTVDWHWKAYVVTKL